MKSSNLAIVFLPVVLAACATAPSKLSEGGYTANQRGDGAVEIIVTAATAAPTTSSVASIPLGDMLQRAAARECPTGFDLTQDEAPTVGLDGNDELVATLRGTARCKS